MSAIEVLSKSPERFTGDFRLAARDSQSLSAPEQRYVEVLTRVLDALAHDEQRDAVTSNATAASAHVQARRRGRALAATELQAQAADVANDRLVPDIAADNALVIKGKYVAERDRIATALFVVGHVADADGRATELLINVASGLPPPNDIPSPDKQALFVSLMAANTVIKTVAQRMRDRAGRWYHRWLTPTRAAGTEARAARLLDQYTRKLTGIGQIGLEGDQVQLAKAALDGLQAEFVAEEASRIKNEYVRSLGVASGIAAGILFALFGLARAGCATMFLQSYSAFLLAAGAAAIGTWLSFSIRRVTLSFNELGTLEDDLLDPSLRVIFVVTLTIAACLLFETGAMNIEIGDLKTKGFSSGAAATALLVGVFFGVSERALATAISGRAAAFVKGVGG